MSEITPSQTVGPFFAYGLTPKGRALAQKERPVYFRDYEKILLAGMSPRETDALREALGRMLENMNHRAEPESSEREPQRAARSA